MIRSRPTAGVLVTAVSLLILGAGVYARTRSTGEVAQASALTAPPAATTSKSFATDVAIPVEGVPVVRGTLMLSVSAVGQAEAWRRVMLTTQVAGRVAAAPVRESQVVNAREIVVALDPVEYALAVEQAEAAVRSATAQYQEMTLFDDRISDPGVRAERERVARSKSGLDAAEVQLKKAQLDVEHTRIGAPFPGRIANLEVVPGEWVRPGDALMTLLDLDPMKVEVRVLESEIGQLAPGRRAQISFAAFPGEMFAGRIATINPVVDSTTRTARATVLVRNPDGRILPGMYAEVSMDAQAFADRVLVPRSAVLERDGRTMLFVYEDGRAKWRYVTTGLQNDSLVEIVPNPETDSVAPGEIVLTGGHNTLIHDARVRLVQDAAAAGGRPE